MLWGMEKISCEVLHSVSLLLLDEDEDDDDDEDDDEDEDEDEGGGAAGGGADGGAAAGGAAGGAAAGGAGGGDAFRSLTGILREQVGEHPQQSNKRNHFEKLETILSYSRTTFFDFRS